MEKSIKLFAGFVVILALSFALNMFQMSRLGDLSDVYIYLGVFVISVLASGIIVHFTMRNINAPVREAVDVLNRMANGDFDARVEGNYSGDMEILKEAVNFTTEQLESYTEEMLKAMEEMQRIEVAEESNKAKSLFLARMSHEIRTPVTAVLGISEIRLHDTDLPPHIEDSFARIHHSASILIGIINDILDLSKIEAGKMELISEKYEVASLINDAVSLRSTLIGDKDIKFHLQVDENLPEYLFGDMLRIGQIMTNLLSNAFKYTDKGDIELNIRISGDQHMIQRIRHAARMRKEDEGDIVILEIHIQDTGRGMTKEQLESVHKDYSRFHERESRFIGGTGLGMPIVYNLVKMMNAKITLDSKVNKGTHICIKIPQKRIGTGVLGIDTAQSLQNFEEIAPPATNFYRVTQKLSHAKVLVVDDVAANLYVSQGIFALYDLNIETCQTGHDAIAKIKQGNEYDIIFMDYMMPNISGIEVMQELRELGYNKPIVALTANALLGQAEEFLEHGFDAFLSKPIRTKQLEAVLLKFIEPEDISEPEVDAQLWEEMIPQLQQDFVQNHSDTASKIIQALNKKDIESATLLAHSLKGIATNIKENELSQAAETIEATLTQGKTPTPTQLDNLVIEIALTLSRIGE